MVPSVLDSVKENPGNGANFESLQLLGIQNPSGVIILTEQIHDGILTVEKHFQVLKKNFNLCFYSSLY